MISIKEHLQQHPNCDTAKHDLLQHQLRDRVTERIDQDGHNAE